MQAAVARPWVAGLSGTRISAAAATALFLAAAAIFLFVDARTPPIVLWDESRNAVNALEMRHSGFGLVTTYEFRPDLWNTKPPLLIWLMTASMALFGPTEWAMRLPSAAAAMATLLILILFVRRMTGSAATALTAGAFLLLSPGFFGEAGARTADYDALLLFFTTAYLFLLFGAVHRRRPSLRTLLLIGGLIAGAAMTKTIAGLIPGTGVALYLLASGRWPRIRENVRWYGALAAVAAAPLLIFYAVREAAGPGYLAAVVHNDLLGRFSEGVTGMPKPRSVYLQELGSGWFFAGPFLLAVPLALRELGGRSRALMIYCLWTAGTMLVVYSASSTRLLHYALPAFPPLAVAAALTVRAIVRKFVVAPWREASLTGAFSAVAVGAAALLLLGQLGGRSLYWRRDGFPAREFSPQASYGDLFAAVAGRGASRLIVVDPGFPLEDRPNYVPLLRAYALMWRERGLEVEHRASLAEAGQGVVASCEPAVAAVLGVGSDRMGAPPGCAVVAPAR
jgi:4-amino-4-deoxy-L-arabinose transferase-like glycosyltransferase